MVYEKLLSMINYCYILLRHFSFSYTGAFRENPNESFYRFIPVLGETSSRFDGLVLPIASQEELPSIKYGLDFPLFVPSGNFM